MIKGYTTIGFLRGGTMGNNGDGSFEARVEAAARDGEFGFWKEVIKHFPEISRGDVDPWNAISFAEVLKDAIKMWYNTNKN